VVGEIAASESLAPGIKEAARINAPDEAREAR